ncbi:MAG TPA: hypothetical protein PLX59_02500 [Candidatus Cloacimonadota bacterium]|nr:hypothetical protein [Candidatus Cloacimonadota bacterium]
MRKWNYGLVALLTLLLLSSCIVHSSLIFFEKDTVGQPNLLANPGFEASTDTGGMLPHGWSAMNVDRRLPANIKLDYDTVVEGENSIRIDASEQAVMLVSDAFRVRRYGGYYLRIKTRCSLPRAERITLRFLTFTNAGKTTNRFKSTLVTSEEWQSCHISAGFIRETAAFGRIAILIPQFPEGSIWIDDAGAWDVHSFRID